MTHDIEFSASFSKSNYEITLIADSTRGTVKGAGTFEYLDEKIIEAIPNIGYRFNQWSDGNAENPRTIVMTQDTILTAQFVSDICIIASGTCGAEGDNLTWTLTCDSVLTISGTGKMADYEWNEAPWFSNAANIVSVEISEGITSIGDYAFNHCCKISSVSIPSGVTSIGFGAFTQCSVLTSVNMPNTLISIGESAFVGDTCLTSITIPSSVTYIGNWAFENHASKVTRIICEAVNPPVLAAAAYTAVFLGIDKSIPLYVPAESIELYRTAAGWKEFGNIVAIEGTGEVEVDTITVAQALEIGATLEENASTAKQYVIRGYVSSVSPYVEQYGYQNFYIADEPNSTANSNAAGGFYVYRGIPSTGTAVTVGNLVELTCAVRKYVSVSGTITYIENSENPIPVMVLQVDTIPCVIASGTCGAEGGNLTWTLSCDSVLTISGTGAMEDYSSNSNWPWYSYRESITSVVVEDGVTSLGSYAFYYLVNVTSITLPNTVTQIGWYSIGNCYKLTSITIPASVTYISGYAFSYCEKLTAFNVDQNNSYYSSVDGVLFNKDQTQIIRYPIGKEGTHYTIPNTVVSIYDGAFASTKLESIDMPNGINKIGGWAFSDCMGLTSIVIPDQVSYIGTYAFSYCRNLESVTIPMSVTNIANGAFIACDNLKTVTNYSTIPQRVDSACFSYFRGGYYITTSTLYVPAQSLATYQATDVWKDFGTILPIEGTETPIETVEGNYTIYYEDKDSQNLTNEVVTLHVPVAPVIEGFTFVEWRVVEGSLSVGITIQAVYEASELTSAPEVYTNPANHAQKLIRNGNVYILTDDKVYTITGQKAQ